jgi:WD40 repeat protein
VNSVAFSSDGRRIVSGSLDRSVRVWDVSMGEELNLLKGHTGLVRSVAFSSNGRRIVSGSDNSSVQVWDMGCHYIREKAGDSGGDQSHTGWLLSPDQQAYLMFVPTDALLPDSSNILTIPCSAASSIDFTHATLGPRWHDCYCS